MVAGEASIWQPRKLLQLSADTKRIEERLTAIAGQTLFTLKDFTYVLGTGSLEVHKNGLLLTKGVDWAENTISTFSLVVPATAGDQVVAVGYVAITGNVDTRDTDIFEPNYQALRDYAGTEISLWVQGQVTHADGGESFFQKITGAAPGFYVDDGDLTLVPTGGDGSIGWLRLPRKVYSFSTLALAIANRNARPGDTARIDVRTAGNGGGGDWKYILLSSVNLSAGAPTTGSVVASTGVATGPEALALQLQLDNIYDTAQFGALYNNSADDSPAIQATVDEWLEEIQNRKITDESEGSTTVGTSPVLKFSPKKCLLGSTMNMTNENTGFGQIDFGGVIFLPHPSFNLSTFAIEIFGHATKIKGFDNLGFTKFMKLANNNLNTGMTIVEDWGSSVTGLVFELDSQSTVTVFRDYRMNKVKKVIRITGGDKVIFKEGWLSVSALENTLDGYFELDAPGLFPSLDIKDMLYVPIPQTETNIALVCIREAGLVHLDAALFGGEPAPIPLVMNLANGTLGSLRGCHITITNTLGFTSGANDIPTVELYALPNSVVFTNHTGFVEQTHTKNLVFFNTLQRSFAQAEIDLGVADFQIRVDGRQVNNFLGQQSADKSTLVKFYTSDAPTKRDFASQVNNVTPQTILTKEQGGKGVSYMIQILNSGNSASDTYSEYVAVSNNTASPNAVWSLLARVEGVSTVASRLAVNGSGDIEVTGNSGALSDFEIIMHKIGVTEEF